MLLRPAAFLLFALRLWRRLPASGRRRVRSAAQRHGMSLVRRHGVPLARRAGPRIASSLVRRPRA